MSRRACKTFNKTTCNLWKPRFKHWKCSTDEEARPPQSTKVQHTTWKPHRCSAWSLWYCFTVWKNSMSSNPCPITSTEKGIQARISAGMKSPGTLRALQTAQAAQSNFKNISPSASQKWIQEQIPKSETNNRWPKLKNKLLAYLKDHPAL